MGLEIALLGGVTLRPATPGGDGPQPVTIPQVQVAFAQLVLARRHGIPRDTLAEVIWPSCLPTTWAAALRSIVSQVRGLVAGAVGARDVLVARSGSYFLRLPPDTVVDVEAGEEAVGAAQRALAEGEPGRARELAVHACRRLRAPFLPHHDGEWVVTNRVRFREQLVIGLEAASQAARACGDHALAVSSAREAVAESPLRESAHRCLMTALAASGDRAEALRTYQQLRRALADELGVDPEPATEDVYLQLLGPLPRHDRTGGTGGTSTDGAEARAFVGREAEMAVATRAWARARAGGREVLLVSGDAGTGKTRFAAELARQAAADGGLTLFGRSDRDAAIPYQPFVEMLDPLLAATPTDEHPDLGAAARSALAAVFPAYAAHRGQGSSGDRTVLLDAVARLVDGLARNRPLLLVLDDQHWADSESLLMLRHVLRHARRAPLLVMVLVRDHPRPYGPLVDDMRRDGYLGHVRLHDLGPADCEELVRQLAPDGDGLDALAPDLLAETSGNPFMIVELVYARRRDAPHADVRSAAIPTALSHLVTGRLAHLEATARDLVAAGAVLGTRFEADVAVATARLDATAAREALDAALAAGLVVEADLAGDEYEFAQGIVRRTIYERLGRARRRHLHRCAAEAIEGLRGDRSAVAHHLCAAAVDGTDSEAARSALRAASHAATSGAERDTVQWCQRALAHVPPGDEGLEVEVRTELGLALDRLGDAGAERMLFDAAVRARMRGALDVAGRAALGLADIARRRPRLRDDAAAVAEDVLTAQSAAASGTARWPTVQARLVARHLELGGSAAGRHHAAASAVERLRHRLRELTGPDHRHDRMALARDLHTVAEAIGHREACAVAHHHRAMAAAVSGDGRDAEAALSSLGRVLGAAEPGWSGRLHLAHRLLDDRRAASAVVRGRFADVPAVRPGPGAPAGNETPDLGVPPPGGMAGHQLVVGHWLRGRVTVESLGAGDGDLLAAERALATLAAGSRGRARLMLHELASGGGTTPADDRWLHQMGIVALGVAELGDPVTAAAVHARLLPYEALTCGAGYRSFVGPVALHLGTMAALMGELPDAERRLTAALRLLSTTEAPPWMALAQHALAHVLEVRARPSDRQRIGSLRAEARRLSSRLGLRLLDLDGGDP